MDEKFVPKNIETNRDKFIKAKAELDAGAYIKLMREKSPDSLEFQPNGEVIINAVKGREMLDYAQRMYNLTSQEMMNYLTNLATAVKQILLSKNLK